MKEKSDQPTHVGFVEGREGSCLSGAANRNHHKGHVEPPNSAGSQPRASKEAATTHPSRQAVPPIESPHPKYLGGGEKPENYPEHGYLTGYGQWLGYVQEVLMKTKALKFLHWVTPYLVVLTGGLAAGYGMVANLPQLTWIGVVVGGGGAIIAWGEDL